MSRKIKYDSYIVAPFKFLLSDVDIDLQRIAEKTTDVGYERGLRVIERFTIRKQTFV